MKIAPGITNQLTFSKIHEDMNKTPVANKHMDKSLRLIHRTQDKVNFDELKVHTSISRLIGKDRGTKRTDAMDLIKQSVVRELGGNQEQANSVLDKVGLTNKDRITMREINALKTEVEKQKLNNSVGTILKSVLEENGGGITHEQLTEAFAHLGSSGRDKVALKKDLDINSIPVVSNLLKSATDEPSVRQVLKKVVDGLDDFAMGKFRNLKPETMEISTFNNLQEVARAPLTTLKNQVHEQGNKLLDHTFETSGRTQVPIKLQQIKNLRTNPTPVLPLTQSQKIELREGGIGNLLLNGQWTMAGGGAGGAMIVRDPLSPSGGAVVKLEENDKTNVAVEVTKLFDAISDSPNLQSPLPFDFSGAYRVDVKNDGSLQGFKDKISDLKDNSQGRVLNNVKKHAVNVDSQNFSVSKLPLINGTEVNKFSATERLALLKSPDFAKDLGKVMVIGRLMGLNDHVSMNGIKTEQGDDTANTTGQINISNLMINKDTGRLVVIDPSTNSEKKEINEENQQWRAGYSDQKTLTLLGNAKQYMIDNFDSPVKIQKEMAEALNVEGTITPVSRFAQEIFFGLGNDSMIGEHEPYLTEKLSDKERQHFVANVYLGIIEGLKYVRTNETAFVEGGNAMNGEFMSDPSELITGITSGLDQLDTAIEELGKYLLN